MRAIGTGKATTSHLGTQIGVQESLTTTMERIVQKLALVVVATFGGMMFRVTTQCILSVKSTSQINRVMSKKGSFKYIFYWGFLGLDFGFFTNYLALGQSGKW